MKNTNRTGRQKYFSADRRCKDCVYNGGKRRASVFVLRIFALCLLKFDRFAEKGKTNENSTDI